MLRRQASRMEEVTGGGCGRKDRRKGTKRSTNYRKLEKRRRGITTGSERVQGVQQGTAPPKVGGKFLIWNELVRRGRSMRRA